jgi:hypothetical protein
MMAGLSMDRFSPLASAFDQQGLEARILFARLTRR